MAWRRLFFVESAVAWGRHSLGGTRAHVWSFISAKLRSLPRDCSGSNERAERSRRGQRGRLRTTSLPRVVFFFLLLLLHYGELVAHENTISMRGWGRWVVLLYIWSAPSSVESVGDDGGEMFRRYTRSKRTWQPLTRGVCGSTGRGSSLRRLRQEP